jgi:ankyrin repeat protein
MVQLLLARGFEIFNAICTAADIGDRDAVELLLARGANTEVKNHKNYTPLRIAALHGNIEIASLLLKYGANIDAKSEAGSTALMLAVGVKDKKTVKFLIDNNADINIKDQKGFNALYCAIMQDNQEMVNLLLNIRTIDIKLVNNHNLYLEKYDKALIEYFKYPLNKLFRIDIIAKALAINYPNSKALAFLQEQQEIYKNNDYCIEHSLHLIIYLMYKVGFNYQNNKGETFLFRAIYNGHDKLVTALLANTNNLVDYDIPNNIGWSPLYLSLLHDELEIFRMLLEKGAQINALITDPLGNEKTILDVVLNLYRWNFYHPKNTARDLLEYHQIVAFLREKTSSEDENDHIKMIHALDDNQDQSTSANKKPRIESTDHELGKSDNMAITPENAHELQNLLASAKSTTLMREVVAHDEAEEAGMLIVIPEYNHQLDHKNNILAIMEKITAKEIDASTVIALERPASGEFSLETVKSLAEILENNPASISPELRELNIYTDAMMYNLAKSHGIKVIGIDEANLPINQYHEDYHYTRVKHFCDEITKIINAGYNVVFSAGSWHVKELQELASAMKMIVLNNDVPQPAKSVNNYNWGDKYKTTYDNTVDSSLASTKINEIMIDDFASQKALNRHMQYFTEQYENNADIMHEDSFSTILDISSGAIICLIGGIIITSGVVNL